MRDYYPEFRIVVDVDLGAKYYEIETIAVFSVGLHDPQKHDRGQAVELVCRDLLEQGAENLQASATRRGLEVTCEMVRRTGDIPEDLKTPVGLLLLERSAVKKDYWTVVHKYHFLEDPDVFKTLYKSAGKK